MSFFDILCTLYHACQAGSETSLESVIKVMDRMLLILPLLLTVQTGVRGDLAGYSGVPLLSGDLAGYSGVPSGDLAGYSGVSGGYQQNSVALTGSLSRSGGATHVSWGSKAKVV